MKLLQNTLVCVLVLTASADARAPDQVVFYVSESESDLADGASPETAFQSLERARDAAGLGEGAVTIYLSGTFVRSEPFRLGKLDHFIVSSALSLRPIFETATLKTRGNWACFDAGCYSLG